MKYSILIILSIFIFSVSSVYSFEDQNRRPPQNNTPGPINVGNSFQAKEGPFQSNSNIRAPIFYDSLDTRFYLRPSRISRMNSIFLTQEISAPIFYDSLDARFSLSPSKTSNLNSVIMGRARVTRAPTNNNDLTNKKYVDDIAQEAKVYTQDYVERYVDRIVTKRPCPQSIPRCPGSNPESEHLTVKSCKATDTRGTGMYFSGDTGYIVYQCQNGTWRRTDERKMGVWENVYVNNTPVN